MFLWAHTSIREGVEGGQMQKKCFYIWTSGNCWYTKAWNWHGGLDEGHGNGLGRHENRGFGLGMHVAVGFGPGRCCFRDGGGKLA